MQKWMFLVADTRLYKPLFGPSVRMSVHHKVLFRCVRQERISIRGSVRPSVCRSVGPSVRRSVRHACAKNAFLGCFWPRWDPTLKQMINQHVFWESLHPSVRPSVSPYICHMINTRWDTARTHRCPGGLVFIFIVNRRKMVDRLRFGFPSRD